MNVPKNEPNIKFNNVNCDSNPSQIPETYRMFRSWKNETTNTIIFYRASNTYIKTTEYKYELVFARNFTEDNILDKNNNQNEVDLYSTYDKSNDSEKSDSDEEKKNIHITPQLFRLSVGLEDYNDIYNETTHYYYHRFEINNPL